MNNASSPIVESAHIVEIAHLDVQKISISALSNMQYGKYFPITKTREIIFGKPKSIHNIFDLFYSFLLFQRCIIRSPQNHLVWNSVLCVLLTIVTKKCLPYVFYICFVCRYFVGQICRSCWAGISYIYNTAVAIWVFVLRY